VNCLPGKHKVLGANLSTEGKEKEKGKGKKWGLAKETNLFI
jgi:hypothetical protein